MVNIKRNWRGIAAAALSITGLLASQAGAAPLNLAVHFPDLQISDLVIAYDADTGDFTANQTTYALFTYSDGVSSDSTSDWSYALSASLDSTTGELNAGSLEILEILDGTITTQLTGSLTAFGHQNDPEGENDVFEFLFDPNGGELADDFGAQGGIIIRTGTSSFAGDFTTDFTATSFSSDTFAAVPVPAAAWLFASGLLGLTAVARRRRQD